MWSDVITYNHCNPMSNYRFDCNTWAWLQYRNCFPGRADTAAGRLVHWHGAGAVVQWPGHRGRTDNYRATERTLFSLRKCHVTILTQSKVSLKGVCVTCVDRYLPSWRSCQEVLSPDRRTMAVHLLLQHGQEPEPKKTTTIELI